MTWRKRIVAALIELNFNNVMKFAAIEIISFEDVTQYIRWGGTTVVNPNGLKTISTWLRDPPTKEIIRWWIMAYYDDLPPDVIEVRFHAVLPRDGRGDLRLSKKT